jgi:hypothetical protein
MHAVNLVAYAIIVKATIARALSGWQSASVSAGQVHSRCGVIGAHL